MTNTPLYGADGQTGLGMTTFEFTVEVTGADAEDERVLNAFFAAVQDGSIEDHGRHTAVWFARAASTADLAVKSALEDLSRALPAATVVRVLPDLVTIGEIAARIEVSEEAVRLWAAGRRGPGDFPVHVATVGRQTSVWRWPDVHAWLLAAGRVVDMPVPVPQQVVDETNVQIARRRRGGPLLTARGQRPARRVATAPTRARPTHLAEVTIGSPRVRDELALAG